MCKLHMKQLANQQLANQENTRFPRKITISANRLPHVQKSKHV